LHNLIKLQCYMHVLEDHNAKQIINFRIDVDYVLVT